MLLGGSVDLKHAARFNKVTCTEEGGPRQVFLVKNSVPHGSQSKEALFWFSGRRKERGGVSPPTVPQLAPPPPAGGSVPSAGGASGRETLQRQTNITDACRATEHDFTGAAGETQRTKKPQRRELFSRSQRASAVCADEETPVTERTVCSQKKQEKRAGNIQLWAILEDGSQFCLTKRRNLSSKSHFCHLIHHFLFTRKKKEKKEKIHFWITFMSTQ